MTKSRPYDTPFHRSNFDLAALASATLVVLALTIVATTVFVAFRTHHPLPLQEEWMNIIVFKSWLSGVKPLEDLLSQHSEHRILFPRLVMFADYIWFDGRGYFSLSAIVFGLSVLATVHLFLLYRLGLRNKGAIIVAAMILMLLFSLAQWENFRSGIQVYFVGVFAAASCAILLFNGALQRARENKPSTLLVAAAFVLLGVATFSMASGLLSGVILTITALLARARWRYTASASLMTAALAGAYFYHYRFPDVNELYSAFGPPPQDPLQPPWLQGPIGILLFTLAYLGNFLDPWIAGAVALGAAGSAVVAMDFWRFVVARDASWERLTVLGVALFAGGSAFLTALGRLPHEGLDASMSSRYTLGSACFWCCVLISCWSLTDRFEYRRARLVLLGALCSVLAAAVLVAQAPDAGAAILRNQTFLQEMVGNALLQDLFDQEVIEATYTKPEWVRSLTPLLKQRGMSIFATCDARLFGAPLSDAGTIDDAPCPGSFDAAAVDESLGRNGVRVSGSAVIDGPYLSSIRVYIVDEKKKIVGFASRPEDETDWTGYATAGGRSTLTAYARQTSGRLCRLGAQTVSIADATNGQ